MFFLLLVAGVMDAGHYVSYAKTEQNNWVCFNDSAAKQASVAIDSCHVSGTWKRFFVRKFR